DRAIRSGFGQPVPRVAEMKRSIRLVPGRASHRRGKGHAGKRVPSADFDAWQCDRSGFGDKCGRFAARKQLTPVSAECNLTHRSAALEHWSQILARLHIPNARLPSANQALPVRTESEVG